jgi:hypothetical protein
LSPGYGDEVTVRQLMSDTSGLVDDNDLGASPAAFAQALANVDDAELTAQLTALFDQVETDRSTPVDAVWLVRLAAWQPLVFAPAVATTTRTSAGTLLALSSSAPKVHRSTCPTRRLDGGAS